MLPDPLGLVALAASENTVAAMLILLLVLAATAVGGRRTDAAAAAAFVVHQFMRHHHHRHCYDGKLHLSGGVSEVFQSAIRSLDKRQQSKERLLERRRQRRREQQHFDDPARMNNSNDSDDAADSLGIHFVSPLLDDGYPPAVREYEEEGHYYSSSTSTITRRQLQQRRRRKNKKPLLLYLPGFDGTIIAPFIQYPALNEEFNVCAMNIDMCNRSTFDELIYYIVHYLLTECKQQSNNDDDADDDDDDDDNNYYNNNNNNKCRQQKVYLMGESFGGLLAIEVALELQRPSYMNYGIELCGLILVNPATSYLRSNLYKLAPIIVQQNNKNKSNKNKTNQESILHPVVEIIDNLRYTIAIVTKLIPLFTDNGQSLRQLVTILSSHGLPSVINTPCREAYMGRVAFTLFDRISFMSKETLHWRLEEWLEWGASIFEDRLDMLTSARLSTASTSLTESSTANDINNDTTIADTTQAAASTTTMTNDRSVIENYSLLKISQELRTLIIVGEYDNTLPSIEESHRLSNELFRNSVIHVVPNAGHASTCGGSLNLITLLRSVFTELNTNNDKNVDDETRRRRQRQQSSSSRIGNENDTPTKELYGLVPRYDNAWIGLNPLLYWSKEYYQKCDRRK
jgi:pimeloyl-ACP methyl ester carboxylesterase